MLAAVWGCRSEHDLQQDVNIPVIQWGDTQHLSLAFNLNSIEADVRSICTYLSKKKKNGQITMMLSFLMAAGK